MEPETEVIPSDENIAFVYEDDIMIDDGHVNFIKIDDIYESTDALNNEGTNAIINDDDDPNLMIECIEVDTKDELKKIQRNAESISNAENAISDNQLIIKNGDSKNPYTELSVSEDPLFVENLSHTLQNPQTQNVLNKLFGIINKRQGYDMKKKDSCLYLIAPKVAYDAIPGKPKNFKPLINVEDVFATCNRVLSRVKSGENLNDPDVNVLCLNPTILEVNRVKLKNIEGYLSPVYVIMSQDISEYSPLSMDEVRYVCCRNRLKDKILRSISCQFDMHGKAGDTSYRYTDPSFYNPLIRKPVIPSNSGLKDETSRRATRVLIKDIEKHLREKYDNLKALRKQHSDLKLQIQFYKNSDNELKRDMKILASLLSKYLEKDAVTFFLNQVKISGKKGGAFRWSDEDKLFALTVMYKNQIDYNILSHNYSLPTAKTLQKFVQQVKKHEEDL